MFCRVQKSPSSHLFFVPCKPSSFRPVINYIHCKCFVPEGLPQSSRRTKGWLYSHIISTGRSSRACLDICSHTFAHRITPDLDPFFWLEVVLEVDVKAPRMWRTKSVNTICHCHLWCRLTIAACLRIELRYLRADNEHVLVTRRRWSEYYKRLKP